MTIWLRYGENMPPLVKILLKEHNPDISRALSDVWRLVGGVALGESSAYHYFVATVDNEV